MSTILPYPVLVTKLERNLIKQIDLYSKRKDSIGSSLEALWAG